MRDVGTGSVCPEYVYMPRPKVHDAWGVHCAARACTRYAHWGRARASGTYSGKGRRVTLRARLHTRPPETGPILDAVAPQTLIVSRLNYDTRSCTRIVQVLVSSY